MRTYCYRTDDNEIIEMQEEPGFAAGTIELPDGRVARRDYQTELFGSAAFVKETSNPAKLPAARQGYPMMCYASGVHASQAGELREHFKRNGLNVEVTGGGNPIYTSAAQRKKALKLRGLFDKSSFN